MSEPNLDPSLVFLSWEFFEFGIRVRDWVAFCVWVDDEEELQVLDVNRGGDRGNCGELQLVWRIGDGLALDGILWVRFFVMLQFLVWPLDFTFTFFVMEVPLMAKNRTRTEQPLAS